VRWIPLILPLFLLAATPSSPLAPRQSGTPQAADPPPAAQDVVVEAPETFDDWLARLIEEARQRGFSDDLIGQTLAGLQPLPRVIQADRSQAELNPGFATYLSTRLTAPVIARGREMAVSNGTLLKQIEQTFGVQGRFLLAIWGMESRYGRVTGSTPIFRALATLAWEPRRADFFRGELFNALMMVDRGYIDAPSMTGSWAGAMGQTQFMPSSYMKYAVDVDGDGHRDIWRSTPDALGSIASYLKGYGWNGDETWGREVRVSAAAQARIDETVPRRPEGCYAIRNMTERVPLREWQRLGVRTVTGGRLPAADIAAGLVDVGERKFLVYPNYDAILGYNCAHYYALTVALLSDQIAASGPVKAAPRVSSPRKRRAAAAKPSATRKKPARPAAPRARAR
jgi:membrane-bound lytic murein transglycosylase B